MKYLHERRKALGGYVPQRRSNAEPVPVPPLEVFKELLKGSGKLQASSTMAFVRLLTLLLRDAKMGRRVVPIIPDEARTFGMDALFREYGIYSPKGQLYEPVDKENFLYYQESKDGQLLEEGINEAGSMSSFIAAGSAYSTHGVPMMPFYIYYSMFGFQRVGDLIWAAADTKVRGFLLGGTSGRTTLNGEGLQHQDGHSLLMASSVPTLRAYDAAFSFELAVIIQDGLRRMLTDREDCFYYLALYNENITMPAMPEGVEEGIVKGLYKFKAGPEKLAHKAQILASGPIVVEALRAQEILAQRYGVSADVWSATSYKALRGEAMQVQRWNMLHPEQKPRVSYVESVLAKEKGPFVAVSDNLRLVADQIAPWVPGGLLTLGTEGFGRSDSRAQLRRFFEIDTECIVAATLYALARKGAVKASLVTKAMKELGLDPEKVHPFWV
jgi:pyruvate dehydrogenase E1 component